MQCGHAMAVARFAIDTGLEQGLLQAQPAQAHRQRQRRITGRRGGERIGATFQQFQCQLFQATGGLVVLRTRGEEACQATASGRRQATLQHDLQRRHRVDAARQQREHRRVGAGVTHVGIGTVGQQPIDRTRLQRQFRIEQQATQFFRLAQLGQRGHAFGVAEAQRFTQQGQRRTVRQQATGTGGFAALGQAITDRGRQRIGGVQQSHDRPAAGFGSVVHRTATDRIGGIGGDAQFDQALDQQR